MSYNILHFAKMARFYVAQHIIGAFLHFFAYTYLNIYNKNFAVSFFCLTFASQLREASLTHCKSWCVSSAG